MMTSNCGTVILFSNNILFVKKKNSSVCIAVGVTIYSLFKKKISVHASLLAIDEGN